MFLCIIELDKLMFLQFKFSIWYIDNLLHIYCDYIEIKIEVLQSVSIPYLSSMNYTKQHKSVCKKRLLTILFLQLTFLFVRL